MTRLASPLGDVELAPVQPRHWAIAAAAAVAMHVGGVAVWLALPEAEPEPVSAETMTIVALGPPGGRLESFEPPPPEEAPPEPEAAANRLTERAADAPPIVRTAPPEPPPPDARLSSAMGSGGEGALPPLIEPAPPPPPPSPEPRLEPGAMRAYARDASQLILERLRYPEDARRAEVQGRAQIRLVIARDGRLISHELLTGSGHARLDEAVNAAVLDVRRFPALPRNYPEPQLRFIVSVRFTLAD
ncbi:MAG: energy transducer TonB [Thermaurantiacus sp.]